MTNSFKIASSSDCDVDRYVSIEKFLESIFDIGILSSEREFANQKSVPNKNEHVRKKRETDPKLPSDLALRSVLYVLHTE
jgi:hypothetical protein